MSALHVGLMTVCLAFGLSGCGYSVHLIHTSDFKGADKAPDSEMVVAESEQFVIFGFATESNFVEQAYQRLLSQCDGRITGITTKYSTDLSFLSYTNRLRMTGLCINR